MPIIFNKVDFPEPEGPMMEINSPSSISRLILLRIIFLFPPTW
jgi:hypothetical protein